MRQRPMPSLPALMLSMSHCDSLLPFLKTIRATIAPKISSRLSQNSIKPSVRIPWTRFVASNMAVCHSFLMGMKSILTIQTIHSDQTDEGFQRSNGQTARRAWVKAKRLCCGYGPQLGWERLDDTGWDGVWAYVVRQANMQCALHA